MAFLLICFSCIFLPVVFYAFIVELKKEAICYSEILLFGILSLGSLIFISFLLYINLLLIFGKLKIILDEGKIVVSQYLSGIPLGTKKILLDGCSRLVLKSDSSSSNAFIFKNNGRIQIFQMNPVAYSIKIQRADGSDDILSSGNYLLMLKLFQQIADRYAALTPEIDTNNEKMLFGASQKNFFQNMSASLMIFRHMAIFKGRPGHAPNSGILDWGYC